MQRYNYDMSHYTHVAGKIGRLQTLKTLHVVGGESWSFDINGITRQSPLARDLVVDALSDIFIFYMPYRHVHGDDWIDFMKDGLDESVTFTQGTDGAPNNMQCLGFPQGTFESGVVPIRYTAMYNRIWNWYFRVRSDTTGVLADATLPNSSPDMRNYGRLISRLPAQWTQLMNSSNLPSASDREIATATVLDIVDLDKKRGEYESKILRDWFGNEYTDIMDSQFGSEISVDQEEKPTLLWHDRKYMSGYDVDGTDDVTLGQYSGKSVMPVQVKVPWKFFPEHGMVMIMQALRYPTLHEEEHHYLAPKTQMDYLEFSGDPQILEDTEPQDVVVGDIFGSTTSSTVLGKAPAAWYYRQEPSNIHFDFNLANGFPFLQAAPASADDAWYHTANDYSDTFQTEQFGHWRTHLRIGAEKKSPVPPAIRSIYAGV
jgi:hypothetical protein